MPPLASTEVTVPYNELGVPLLNDGDIALDNRNMATQLSASSRPGWRNVVRTLVTLSEEPLATAWAMRDHHPGLAIQALRSDTRAWLQLLAKRPNSDITALLSGQALDIPWEEVPGELQEPITGNLLVEPGAFAHLQAIPMIPILLRGIEAEVRTPHRVIYGPVFGGGEPGIDMITRHRVKGFVRAESLYRSWLALDIDRPVKVHYAPEIPEPLAQQKSAEMSSAAQSIQTWAGASLPSDYQVDVFLYPTGGMPRYGLEADTDFSIISEHQVHQQLGSTRGHELTHIILSELWGPPGTEIMSEGVATFMNLDFDSVERARRNGVCEWVDLLSLEAEFHGFGSEYLAAGAFVAFAESRIGRDHVRTLWSSPTPIEDLSLTIGVSAAQLNDDYRAFLTGGEECGKN